MAPRAGQLGLHGLLLVTAALSQPAAPCPFQCYCFGGPKLLLRCASGAELRQPPRDVPPDARNLTIVGANLTVLRAAAFAGGDADGDGDQAAGVRLPLLNALRLTHNHSRGIQRWMRNLREACRDQMEGYHYRYEQDADPRRVPAPAAPAGSRATSPGSGL
ncbi:hypothetical protein H8957_001799 [Semnopithecus entellus]